jgi:hypothetical protein
MRFVVAGNYNLDPSTVAMHLLRKLAELPIDSVVLMRSPQSGQPGPIERIASDLCKDLSIPVEWRIPKPGAGSEGTIERDYRMVDDADGVLAYFHPDHAMNDERGTTRLIRYALSVNKPVDAFTADHEKINWLGSNEKEVQAHV